MVIDYSYLLCDVFDSELLVERRDSLADDLVALPVLLLLLPPKVADQLAAPAHLQASNLHRNRTKTEPRSEKQIYNRNMSDYDFISNFYMRNIPSFLHPANCCNRILLSAHLSYWPKNIFRHLMSFASIF